MAAIAGSAHIMYSGPWTGSQTGRDGTEHTHNSTTLLLKDPLSLSTIDWPPEVHKHSPKKAHSTHNTKLDEHNSCALQVWFIATIQPLSTINSSPHCLRGWSNSTSSQPHPLHAFIAFPLAQLSTRFDWCSLPH